MEVGVTWAPALDAEAHRLDGVRFMERALAASVAGGPVPEESMRLVHSFFTAVALLGASGCYTTWDIRPAQLTKLHGLGEGDPRTLIDVHGEEFQVDTRTEIQLYGPGSEEPEVAAKWAWVTVDGPILGAVKHNGRTISVDLRQYGRARAERLSVGRTVAAIVIPVSLAAMLPALIVVASWMTHSGAWSSSPGALVAR